MDCRILKFLVYFTIPFFFFACKNNDFPQSTKPEVDYITLFGNGDSIELKLNRAGLQSIILEPIAQDEDAMVEYYNKEGEIISPSDFSQVESLVLSNHRLSFTLILMDNGMKLMATESTYFESYYLRIQFHYLSSVESMEVRIEPGHPLLLSSIEYDYSNAEVEFHSIEKHVDTFINDTDREMVFYALPYQGVIAEALFIPDVPWIEGLEYFAPIPKFIEGKWSETETHIIFMIFGETVNFTPLNINEDLQVTFKVDPHSSLTLNCTVTYSTLRVPFRATFLKQNTFVEEIATGRATIIIPVSYTLF